MNAQLCTIEIVIGIALLAYALIWILCIMSSEAEKLLRAHFEFNESLKEEPKDELQDMRSSDEEERS